MPRFSLAMYGIVRVLSCTVTVKKSVVRYRYGMASCGDVVVLYYLASFSEGTV